MSVLRSFAVLGVALVPVIALTAMAFVSDGGNTGPTTYEPAAITELEPVDSTSKDMVAKLPEVEAAAKDPAGFSAEGALGPELVLPYEAARQLAEVERAMLSEDLGVVERAKKSMGKFMQDRLVEVEKLRPDGDRLAEAITLRSEAINRHEVWLTNRDLVSKTVASAAQAMADGPESVGEKSCLELLQKLQEKLPQVASGEDIKAEPADALTQQEAEAVEKLKARAKFRERFFRARRATGATNEELGQLEEELKAWDSFLNDYSKDGAPDERDAAFLENAKKLRYEAELKLRRALALGQSSVSGLVAKVADWLKVAELEKAGDSTHQQQAAKLVHEWLEKTMPLVPAKPEGLEDLKEGVTGIAGKAGKRKLGFFKAIDDSNSYYYWSTKELMKAKRKGENQFVLQRPPADPEYLRLRELYQRERETFLSQGYRSAQGASRFRDACGRLVKEFEDYRDEYEEPENPFDAQTRGWGELFAKAENLAAEFVAEGEKSRIWDRLTPATE